MKPQKSNQMSRVSAGTELLHKLGPAEVDSKSGLVKVFLV